MSIDSKWVKWKKGQANKLELTSIISETPGSAVKLPPTAFRV
jgi:hypothetical protein